jgi:flavorubredoxin
MQDTWGEIIMPFKIMAQKTLEKLEIKTVSPSHGPIYRSLEQY